MRFRKQVMVECLWNKYALRGGNYRQTYAENLAWNKGWGINGLGWEGRPNLGHAGLTGKQWIAGRCQKGDVDREVSIRRERSNEGRITDSPLAAHSHKRIRATPDTGSISF